MSKPSDTPLTAEQDKRASARGSWTEAYAIMLEQAEEMERDRAMLREALSKLLGAAEGMRHEKGDARIARYDGWANEARAALKQTEDK